MSLPYGALTSSVFLDEAFKIADSMSQYRNTLRM